LRLIERSNIGHMVDVVLPQQQTLHRASRSTSLMGKSQWASRISKRRCSSFL
jgi:hypothetical protein